MTPATCEVLSGPGSVARHGESILWASAQIPDPVWATLLACLSLGAMPGDGTAAVLRAVADSLARGDDTGAFVIVLTGGEHALAVVRGRAALTLDGVDVTGPSEGEPVVTLDLAGRTLTIGAPEVAHPTSGPASGPADRSAERSTRHDLVAGTVPGAGLRWRSSTPAPAAGRDRSDPPESTVPPETDGPPETAGPPETTGPPETDGPPESTAPPETSAPPIPGPALISTEVEAATESAPPALVFEDGGIVRLAGDVVLGRRPERHELVTSGAASPVIISDPEHVLSGAHAALRTRDGEVVVVDLDSLNGTHVAGPQARDWTRLTPGAAYPLTDGHRLLLGWTVLTFRTAAP